MDRFIAIAYYTDQPPIDTKCRQFKRCKSFSIDTTLDSVHSWACLHAATNKYTTLDKLEITVDGS